MFTLRLQMDKRFELLLYGAGTPETRWPIRGLRSQDKSAVSSCSTNSMACAIEFDGHARTLLDRTRLANRVEMLGVVEGA